MIISAAMLGAALGTGLWMLWVWVFPPRRVLAARLGRLNATPAPPPILTTDSGGWALRVGQPFIRPLLS